MEADTSRAPGDVPSSAISVTHTLGAHPYHGVSPAFTHPAPQRSGLMNPAKPRVTVLITAQLHNPPRPSSASTSPDTNTRTRLPRASRAPTYRQESPLTAASRLFPAPTPKEIFTPPSSPLLRRQPGSEREGAWLRLLQNGGVARD